VSSSDQGGRPEDPPALVPESLPDLVRAVLERSGTAVMVFDADLRIVYVNDLAARVGGHPVEAHLGRRLGDIHPQTVEQAEPLLRRVLETGEPVLNEETVWESPDPPHQRWYWMVSYVPLVSRDGAAHVAAIYVETTEVRRAHERLALGVVLRVGTDSRRLVLGVMLATAFISMWISNTATTLVMLPVALAILQAYPDKRLQAPLILAIAYSASIGGLGTPIGSPPNLVFMQVYSEATGTRYGFLDWMAIGVPVVLVFLPLMALWLGRGLAGAPAAVLPDSGPWTPGERRVSDLVEAVGGSQSNVSGHLACLRECGLVVDRPGDRRQVFYRLAHPEVVDLLRAAEALLAATGTTVELCRNPLMGDDCRHG